MLEEKQMKKIFLKNYNETKHLKSQTSHLALDYTSLDIVFFFFF